jgi:hypothetical protein
MPHRLPWLNWLRLPLLFALIMGIALLMVLGQMLRVRATSDLDCLAQRAYNWHTMPEKMAEMQAEADARRARLQAALDAQRAASWWAWLTLPAHPPEPGCQTMPF